MHSGPCRVVPLVKIRGIHKVFISTTEIVASVTRVGVHTGTGVQMRRAVVVAIRGISAQGVTSDKSDKRKG